MVGSSTPTQRKVPTGKAGLRFKRWLSPFPSTRRKAQAMLLDRKLAETLARERVKVQNATEAAKAKTDRAVQRKELRESQVEYAKTKKQIAIFSWPFWWARVQYLRIPTARAKYLAGKLEGYANKVKRVEEAKLAVQIEKSKIRREKQTAWVGTYKETVRKNLKRETERLATSITPSTPQEVEAVNNVIDSVPTLKGLSTIAGILEFEIGLSAVRDAFARGNIRDAVEFSELLKRMQDRP